MRGSRRSWRSTRAAVAPVTRPGSRRRLLDRRRNAAPRSSAPVRLGARRACPLASRRPSRRSRRLVAVLRLVHDVAGGEQRRARRRASSVERAPEIAAQHRVEADRRLVEHEQLRARRRARPPATRGRCSPPESRATTRSLCRSRSTVASTSSIRPAGARTIPTEVAEVLEHGQGRRTRKGPAAGSPRVSAAPGRPRPGRATRIVPLTPSCTPTIARMSVDLPLPLGPSSPVTRPARPRGTAGRTRAFRCARRADRRRRSPVESPSRPSMFPH